MTRNGTLPLRDPPNACVFRIIRASQLRFSLSFAGGSREYAFRALRFIRPLPREIWCFLGHDDLLPLDCQAGGSELIGAMGTPALDIGQQWIQLTRVDPATWITAVRPGWNTQQHTGRQRVTASYLPGARLTRQVHRVRYPMIDLSGSNLSREWIKCGISRFKNQRLTTRLIVIPHMTAAPKCPSRHTPRVCAVPGSLAGAVVWHHDVGLPCPTCSEWRF